MNVTIKNANGDVLWTGPGVASIYAAEAERDPILVKIDPAVVPLGSPDCVLHCYGAGFAEGAVIVWNGSPEPTTRISDSELTTGINMATAAVAITLPVAVRNPSGAESVPLAFTFTPAAPGGLGLGGPPAGYRPR